MTEYEINLLPIKIFDEIITLYFSSIDKKDSIRFRRDSLPLNFPRERLDKKVDYCWVSRKKQEGDIEYAIDTAKSSNVLKHLLNHELYKYFAAKDLIINRTFIRDTEVWIPQQISNSADYITYKKFYMKFDSNYLVSGLSLLLSFGGESRVLRNIQKKKEINLDFDSKVIFKNKVCKISDLSIEEKLDNDRILPILYRELDTKLGIVSPYNRNENKYLQYYEQINQFYSQYLKGNTIGGLFSFYESGFAIPNMELIKQTTQDSNLLVFGNNQKNFVPYVGIKENGPLKPLPENQNVKLIFIFHKNDKDSANMIYSYLKNGYKSFPGLESFVKIRFEIDDAKTIRFTDRNPLPEIQNALLKYSYEKDCKYAAIYISQIKKGGIDEEEDLYYYKIKELLINNNIVSQVVERDKIKDPSYNYFLPNISIALLAKLGGVPWRLYRSIQNNLIIGVSADLSSLNRKDNSKKYIGTAVSFNNDGSFLDFNAFEQLSPEQIAKMLKKTIEQYVSENSVTDRLIIHYYKCMSKREEAPIRAMLEGLEIGVPYIIVTVNKNPSEDYILFDKSYDGKMPVSGTYIITKKNEVILCNNTRYSNNTATRIEGFPFPIKLKINTPFNSYKIDQFLLKELIDQVYQFSRMYWKSVRQRNLPVTLEYSTMIAKMVSHFDNKELNDFGRKSIWFL